MRRQSAKRTKLVWVVALLLTWLLAVVPSASVSADSGRDASSFHAASLQDYVLLSWSGGSASDGVSFNLYRGTNFQASGRPLNDDPIPVAAANTSQEVAYQWRDFDVEKGATYYYWLETLYRSGESELRGPIGVLHQSPTAIVVADLKGGAARPSLPLPWIALSLAAVSSGAWALRRRPKLRA